MPKKTTEEIRLMIAQFLNEEHDLHSNLLKNLDKFSGLTSTQQLL